MEECEALCTRLAIMVKGRFTCLGTPQHVRKRFGHVYTLTVRINIAKDEDKVEEFKNFIKVTFPGNIGVVDSSLLSHVYYYATCFQLYFSLNCSYLLNPSTKLILIISMNFYELCKVCLQHWNLTVSLWRATYCLSNSLCCLGISV